MIEPLARVRGAAWVRRSAPIIALIVVSALWGVHAVVGKVAEGQLGPLALADWRFTGGAILCLPWIARLRRLPRRDWLSIAGTALLWAVLYPIFFYWSLRSLTPVASLLIINLSPVMAGLIGWAALKEPVRPLQGLGIAIALGGVVWSALSQGAVHGSEAGVLLVAMAAAAFAAYTVASRALVRHQALLDVVAATSLTGAGELWVITLVGGRAPGVVGALGSLTPTGWLVLGYIVVVVSTGSYLLYGYGLQRVSAAVAAALTFYPQVMFAAVVQWLWLGLVPTAATGVSAGLILGGVALTQWPRGRRAAPTPKKNS